MNTPLTSKDAPGVPADVLAICTAYESGFGDGVSGRDKRNPYVTWSSEWFAWAHGVHSGAKKRGAGEYRVENEEAPRAVAWIRGRRTYVDDAHNYGWEYDEEVVAGTNQPPGDGWAPLYSRPPVYRISSMKDMRTLLQRACNFITSNYFEGDLPAFDKPDALLKEIRDALDGADAQLQNRPEGYESAEVGR